MRRGSSAEKCGRECETPLCVDLDAPRYPVYVCVCLDVPCVPSAVKLTSECEAPVRVDLDVPCNKSLDILKRLRGPFVRGPLCFL